MKITLLILFLALFFVYPVCAQEKQVPLPDLTKFQLIATANEGKIAALADIKDADANGSTVTFNALLAPVVEVVDNSPRLDTENFIVSAFRADCGTKAFAVTHSSGRSYGKSFDHDEEPNTNVAPKGSLIWRVIDEVCKVKVGIRV